MKLFSTLAALVAAGPALAHPGVHAHPHDATGWLPLAMALLVIVAATGALAYIRK